MKESLECIRRGIHARPQAFLVGNRGCQLSGADVISENAGRESLFGRSAFSGMFRHNQTGGTRQDLTEPFCGLCGKNCPLTSPACHKGYAKAESNMRMIRMNDDNDTQEKRYSNEELGDLFRRAARLMKRGGNQDKGYSHPAQGRVLSILGERGPMSRKELLEILDVRSGSLSELLGKLERQGFITKLPDEKDKRGFAVSLTDVGRGAVAEHDKCCSERMETLFSGLSDADRAQFGRILAKLSYIWEAAFDEGGHERHGQRRSRGRQGPHGHGPGGRPHRSHGRERRQARDTLSEHERHEHAGFHDRDNHHAPAGRQKSSRLHEGSGRGRHTFANDEKSGQGLS